MKKKKRQFKILHVFIIGAAIAEFLITITVLGLYFIIMSFGNKLGPIYLSATSLTIFLITVIGIIIATKLGKTLLKPFMSIKKAAKEVTEGNFNISFSEEGRIVEINEIANDFNIMVKELGNTEIFHEDFISNVSHEFKTPLSAIEGYVTLMQDEISEEEKQEYIKSILYNTRRLSSLTGNILMLSKLENRDILPVKEKFRIDMQICNVMVEFNEQWERKELEVDMDLEEIEYYGYRDLLPQVWSNLIQNAIKFTDQGGSLKVICKKEEKEICIGISDTGVGIDEDTIKHIFDKFYQSELSHNTEGNGLGLALVKKIVGLSEGKIEVSSSLGKGSCFTVYLPQES